MIYTERYSEGNTSMLCSSFHVKQKKVIICDLAVHLVNKSTVTTFRGSWTNTHEVYPGPHVKIPMVPEHTEAFGTVKFSAFF